LKRPAGAAIEQTLRNARRSEGYEGHGIAEDVRAHLFEPGRTGRPGGSGLGLAISQLLARQIGATLVLQSTGLDGTTFSLSLPLVAS
jgi:signal transduction histidine kinase